MCVKKSWVSVGANGNDNSKGVVGKERCWVPIGVAETLASHHHDQGGIEEDNIHIGIKPCLKLRFSVFRWMSVTDLDIA